jgi:hypothetical protein
MRRFIWIFAWTSVAVWSLLSFSAAGLVELFWQVASAGGELAPRPPDAFTTGEPHPLEWLFPFMAALRSLGLGAIVVLWLVVSLTILGGAWVLAAIDRALTGGAPQVTKRPRRSALPRRLLRPRQW